MRGAFFSAVAKVKAGATIPLIWGHDANGSPQNFVGEIVDADETSEGLEVHARFDLEDPVARKAWRLVKSGAIDRLSIGYSVRRERRARDGATELLDVDLKEVSLVMNPANERARVLAIKSGADDAEPDVATDVELRRRWAELKASVPRRRSAAEPQREFDRHRLDTIMDGVPRHDPAPAAPSAAELRREWDRLRLELLTDDLDPEAIEAAHDDSPLPTDAELREQAKALGLPVPPPRWNPDYTAVRAQARRQMLTLFEQADGR
jgi:HK97 family phage prohead protease